MYKKVSRRSGGTTLTGWSTGNQGGYKDPSRARRLGINALTVPEIIGMGVDELRVECRCGHSASIPPSKLLSDRTEEKLGAISRRLFCQGCKQRGRVTISLRLNPEDKAETIAAMRLDITRR